MDARWLVALPFPDLIENHLVNSVSVVRCFLPSITGVSRKNQEKRQQRFFCEILQGINGDRFRWFRSDLFCRSPTPPEFRSLIYTSKTMRVVEYNFPPSFR